MAFQMGGNNAKLAAQINQMQEWVTKNAPELAEELQQKIQALDDREAQESASVAATFRSVSAPVPPVLVNKNYTVGFADQRVIHVSPDNHTLTLPNPKDVYRRRNLVENAELGGIVTINGSFVGANPDESGIFDNLILKPGEGVDYLGYFEIQQNGAEDAPADLRLNGELAPEGTKGVYKIKIINTYLAKLPPEEILSKFTEQQSKIDSALNLAQQANNRSYGKADVGLPLVDNTSDSQKPVSFAQRAAIDQAKSEAAAIVRGNVEATGDTLGKIYARVLANETLITNNAPDADLVVNRIAEVLEVFQTYPEGANVAEEFSRKVNVADIVNVLNYAAAGKVADARTIKTLNDKITALETLLQNRPRTIFANSTPSSPIAATLATEQQFPINVAIPANMIVSNRFFRLTITFLLTTVAAPPTITFRIRIGGAIFLATVALPSTASRPNQLLRLSALIGGVGEGVNGTVEAQGEIWFSSTISYPMTNTALLPINTTVDNNFQLSVQYGTAAGAGHFIQRRAILLEALN